MWKIDGVRGVALLRCSVVVTASVAGLVSCRTAASSDAGKGSPFIGATTNELSTADQLDSTAVGSVNSAAQDANSTVDTVADLSSTSTTELASSSEPSLPEVASIAGPVPSVQPTDTTPIESPEPTVVAPSTDPNGTNAIAGPTQSPDYLSTLVNIGDDDGWRQTNRDTVPIEVLAPVRAYFSDDGSPENDPWFVVGRSTRPVGKDCTAAFRSVTLANGSNACLQRDPKTLMRLVVGDRSMQIEGELSNSQAIAAANSILFAQDATTAIVQSDGLPTGLSDQGEFIRVPGTSRAVSISLVGTNVATAQFRHGDGSTIEITSAIDSEEAFEFLRLDRVGGWTLAPLTAVDGYVGKHQVLSDRTVVWFDDDALVQVRSTGAQGATIVDQLTAYLEGS